MKLSVYLLTRLALAKKDTRTALGTAPLWEPATWPSCAEAGLGSLELTNQVDYWMEQEGLVPVSLVTTVADDRRSGTFTQGWNDYFVRCQEW